MNPIIRWKGFSVFFNPDVASFVGIRTGLQNKVSSIGHSCVAPDIPRLLIKREDCLVAILSCERKCVVTGMMRKLKNRISQFQRDVGLGRTRTHEMTLSSKQNSGKVDLSTFSTTSLRNSAEARERKSSKSILI